MDLNSFMGSTINGARSYINNFATHSGATVDSVLSSASQGIYHMEDKAAAATAKANSMISSAKQTMTPKRIRTAKRFGGALLGGAAIMSIYDMLDDDY